MCGFYEAAAPMPESSLKSYLHDRIPEYMIPARFVHMQALPLNRNGKVDRHALKAPDVDWDACEKGYEPPRNHSEQLIAKAWSKVLGKKCVGIHDDFFLIGADSLRAIALVIELEEHFTLSIADIFKYQTIAEQAEHFAVSEVRLSDRIALLTDLVQSPGKDEESAEKERAYLDQVREFGWDDIDLSARRDYQTILLTGVTGTLGGYLLRDLLDLTRYEIILIARGRDHADSFSRVEKRMEKTFGPGYLDQYQSRIRVVNGDVGREQCGCDDETWQVLLSSVDAVIHAAALTKHFGDYQDFYEANVLSTARLVDFCRTGKQKEMHYVSTISVGMGTIPDRKSALLL